MKKLLCLILFSSLFEIGFTQVTNSYNIHISPLLEQRKANSNDKPFNEAISALISFINTGADSLLYDKAISPKEKSMYYDLFFLKNLPRKFSHYHIVSVDSISSGYLFKVIPRQQVDELQSDEVLAIANVQVRNGLIDISYKNNLTDFSTIKKGQITYFTKDKSSFSKVEADKAVAFCDSLKRVLKLKVLPPLNYVLSKKGKAQEIFGFDYFWSPYGCFIPNDLLLSNGFGENYRHELVHYVLQDFKFDALTNEGLAVLLGGSEKMSCQSFLNERFTVYGIPSKEQIKNVFSSTKPNSDSFKYRYALPALCMRMIYDKKGIEGIRDLLKNCEKYSKQNTLGILKDIFGESEDDLIDQLHLKCSDVLKIKKNETL